MKEKVIMNNARVLGAMPLVIDLFPHPLPWGKKLEHVKESGVFNIL